MTTLLVTEERSFAGAAQHPLLRLFYGVFFALLRGVLARRVRRFARQGKVVVVTTRSLARAASFPTGVEVRFYDTLQERLSYRTMRADAWRVVRAFTETLRSLPELTVQGIFLPTVFETQASLHLLSTVYKYRVIVLNLLEEFHPDRIAVLGPYSIAERTALALAKERHLPTTVLRSFGVTLFLERMDQYLREREKKVWHKSLQELTRAPSQVTPRKGEVFLVAFHATHHLKTLVPLARKLEERHRIPSLLLADIPSLEQRMRPFGFPLAQWSPVVHFLPWEAFTQELPRAKRRFGILWERVKSHPILTQYPLKLVQPFLENTFRYDFPLASIFIPGVHALFQERTPHAVITASDRRLQEVLFPMIARQFRVRSILATAITNMSLEMANNYDTCDAVAVPGEYIKKLLIDIGHRPENVHVVGDLRFDDLPERIRSFDTEHFKRSVGIAPDKKIVLLISSDIGPTWTVSKKRNLFQTVARATRKIPDAALLIKAHPNESLALLKQHMGEWGLARVPVMYRENLHELILASHVVVMLYSMVGLEADLLGRPVINIMLEGEDVEHYIPYVTGGGAIGVRSEEELRGALTRLFEDKGEYERWVEKGKTFASRFIRDPDGKVSDRIAELLR